MMIPQPALAELRATLCGAILAPGEPEYDAARQIFNAMIDSRPALIPRCATAGDVVACDPVNFFRSNQNVVTITR